MLEVFHAHVAKTMNGHVVEGVEVPFVVALHDPDTGEVLDEQLVGTMDLVLRHGDHRVVVEHKTAARKWSDDQLAFDLQPTGYKFAAQQVGMGDVGLRLQVVTKTKVPVVQVADVERGPRDEDDFLRTAVGVLRAVDAGVAYPVRGWACKGCPFAHACKPKRPKPRAGGVEHQVGDGAGCGFPLSPESNHQHPHAVLFWKAAVTRALAAPRFSSRHVIDEESVREVGKVIGGI